MKADSLPICWVSGRMQSLDSWFTIVETEGILDLKASRHTLPLFTDVVFPDKARTPVPRDKRG